MYEKKFPLQLLRYLTILVLFIGVVVVSEKPPLNIESICVPILSKDLITRAFHRVKPAGNNTIGLHTKTSKAKKSQLKVFWKQIFANSKFGKLRIFKRFPKERGYKYLNKQECPPSPSGTKSYHCPTQLTLTGEMRRHNCIEAKQICDGIPDCPQGEDEETQRCFFHRPITAYLDDINRRLNVLTRQLSFNGYRADQNHGDYESLADEYPGPEMPRTDDVIQTISGLDNNMGGRTQLDELTNTLGLNGNRASHFNRNHNQQTGNLQSLIQHHEEAQTALTSLNLNNANPTKNTAIGNPTASEAQTVDDFLFEK